MDERQRSLLDRGREHYGANEFEDAARCLIPLAREKRPFADVYAMLGVIYHQKGRLKDAVGMWEQALQLNPAYTEGALNLAVGLNELGRYDEAKQVHERMMASRKGASGAMDQFVKGKIANMHAEVGRAYEEVGLFDEAIHEYQRALMLCPTFVDIRTRLATCFRAAGHFAAAERELLGIKSDHPRSIGPRLQLGMTYYTEGRLTDADREWKEVLDLEPANKFARLYLRFLAKGNSGAGRPPSS